MKNSFKLTVSSLVCGLLLLTGCGTATTLLPGELVGQTGEYPKSVNILAPDFFKETGAADADQAEKQWLDKMSLRYGVKLNVFSNEYEYSQNLNSSAAGQASEGEKFIGLKSINSGFEFKSGISDGSYIPLEEYLADNPVWNALPEDFKSLFKVGGHIYAIPTSVTRAQCARIIHDEALRETGMTVTDLGSFYDFAVAYAKKAGQGTGRGRFAGTFMMPEVTDILNAFGLYPGNDPYTQFNYDPAADCYTDWLTKDTAVSALEYLRELFNAGALGVSSMEEIAQLFDNGIFASEYDPYYDDDNCTEVLTLNPEYPQVLLTEINGFAMTQDTPQPKETINFFIDMLFGSEQNYLDCWLGSSDHYTVNSDGTITVETAQDSEGNDVIPRMPNLTGGLTDIYSYSEADLLFSANGAAETASKTGVDYKTRTKLLSESLKNGSIVEIPFGYQIIKSTTYDAHLSEAYNLYFGSILTAVMDNEKTVRQVVDEYKAEMLNLGGNQMLDEMNAAIGKKTAYYYG